MPAPLIAIPPLSTEHTIFGVCSHLPGKSELATALPLAQSITIRLLGIRNLGVGAGKWCQQALWDDIGQLIRAIQGKPRRLLLVS